MGFATGKQFVDLAFVLPQEIAGRDLVDDGLDVVFDVFPRFRVMLNDDNGNLKSRFGTWYGLRSCQLVQYRLLGVCAVPRVFYSAETRRCECVY